MTAPTNTYTIIFADAHANTYQYALAPGNGGDTMPGKMDALRNALDQLADQAPTILAAFTPGDTLTVTVTQP